jgi:hypothetical protein
MLEQGAAGDTVARQAAALVSGLPIGLQKKVACHMTDDEDEEDLLPPHRPKPYP